jgi:uncharacterized protein YndB with AHSA1/START domain
VPITTDLSVEIAKSPAQVFAFVDDEASAPRWLSRCVEVKRTSPGPKAAGSTLHYTYREGSRQGTMDGAVTAYERDRRLAMTYADRMLQVAIDFTFEPSGGGTRLRQLVTITPRSFFLRLLTPMIRSRTLAQNQGDLRRLRELMEAA